ncbi:lipase secretion chaperone [Chitinimonas sp. BJYL2]|uniref:lipase secretion chaperone n=1 Tax=Chitinimonas sp. BJYL2 TaxID=2976696 RepID=UPI0022B44F87|nr:lipase secretion chaperone [Chitinimonas sp. BJYL2]
MPYPRYLLPLIALPLLLLAGWAVSTPEATAPAGSSSPTQTGTQVDAGTSTTTDVPRADERLKELFDYYLSTEGEQTLDAITRQIDAELAKRFPSAISQDRQRLFRQFLAYRRALQPLDADPNLQGSTPAQARRRLDAARALRSQYFSPAEIDALFGWEDRYDDDALARQQIAADASLNEQQKQARLAELDKQLDPAMLTARQQPVQHLLLADHATQARAQGQSEADIQRWRATQVGEAAADRLAALDREEAAWQQRIQQYLGERRALLGRTDLDAPARQQALQTLRDSRFTSQEQLRLAAYEG